MQRKCRYEPLTQQPLVLVLAQVRFSPLRRMADYIPRIQDHFRKHRFPIDRSGTVQQVVIDAAGGGAIHTQQGLRWEFRNKQETWSVLVTQDSLVLQTTDYGRFEAFAETFEQALEAVLRETDHDRYGVVHRLGLRYVNLVQPRAGEDYRFYLRPGFHGAPNGAFQSSTQRVFSESRGLTSVDEVTGSMILRVLQNDQGYSLPPDLVTAAPKLEKQPKAGEVVTLIDMDHFIEGNFEPSAGWVTEKAYLLHDHLIETFHEHIVTPEGIQVWK